MHGNNRGGDVYVSVKAVEGYHGECEGHDQVPTVAW